MTAAHQWADHFYGAELTLRIAEVTDVTALWEDAAVAGLLTTLVADIGMRVIAGPVVGTELGTPEKAGKSAVVILAESHAAVHTYPGLGQLFLNIFSCKPFEEATVLRTLERLLGPFTVTERNLVNRGEDWPADLPAATKRWDTER
ncbi:S-adenosylmethionine decarboxylase [Amycolatopsis sp. A133]|uniref:S-adenosylmethionine decarboxylase n=1 Tax=Amycolatopsis sp. A133 TaxID=3064472 RepID=UPI0027E69F9C|nr:S-adenosylmethionine decarboxylase [Amycolatopsis sp. A133]MDQ7810289.1 S-adenosylmethionine decarboxylase [Amycolatopsis sp. A133]